MNANNEMNLPVPTHRTGRRQSTLSPSSRRLSISVSEDEATFATISDGGTKEFTVQNPHSRHGLPDVSIFSSQDATSCRRESARHDPWYYSSNHVLINQERVERGLSPLHRRRSLDEMARTIAKTSAEKCKVKKIPAGYKGNITRGLTIRDIHYDMMVSGGGQRKKILNEKYNAFGMGTHKGEDGFLYLVQLFEKTRIDQ